MRVQLHGEAKKAADKVGLKAVDVSISHDGTQAVAVAVAKF